MYLYIRHKYYQHFKGVHNLDLVPRVIPSATTSPMGEKEIKWSLAAFASEDPKPLLLLQTSVALVIEDACKFFQW